MRALWAALASLQRRHASLTSFERFLAVLAMRQVGHLQGVACHALASVRPVLLGGPRDRPARIKQNERDKSNKDFELPLSKAAAELPDAVPKINGKPGWEFTHDDKRAIGGYSKFKAAFDKVMLAELRKADKKAKLPGWVVHDLRRTARSLMSRAGVPPRHAEMALEHLVAGVEGNYDRHRYLDESARRLKHSPLRSTTSAILKTTSSQ